MNNIQDLIQKSLSERDEWKKKSWNPTDLGSCLSGAYYKRLGVKPDTEFDERTLRIFKCGKLFESFVVEQLKKVSTVQEQIRVEMPEYDLTGYADCMIDDVVYEIKSKHSRSFWYMEKEGKPSEHYLMQLYCYLMGLKKNEGRLVFVSKDDLAIAEYQVLLSDTELRGKVLSELAILNKAWKEQKAPEPAPSITNGKLDWRASYCAYHSYCTGDKEWKQKAEKEIKKAKVVNKIKKSKI